MRTFLHVQPRPRGQTLSALQAIFTAGSAASRSTISLSVMSFCSSIRETMKASCASRLDLRRHALGRSLHHPRSKISTQRLSYRPPPSRWILNHRRAVLSLHKRFIDRKTCSSDGKRSSGRFPRPGFPVLVIRPCRTPRTISCPRCMLCRTTTIRGFQGRTDGFAPHTRTVRRSVPTRSWHGASPRRTPPTCSPRAPLRSGRTGPDGSAVRRERA